MTRWQKLTLLCAPLVVVFEWFCFVIVLTFSNLDFNKPLSALPYYYPELATFFGSVLTIIAVLFTIFTLALRHFWKDVFKFAIICSIFFIIAGWSPYNPFDEGSFWSVVHAGAANLSVLGYTFVIFQISQRAHGALRQGSKVFFHIALLGILGVTLAIHVLNAYAAWFQMFLVLNVQAWCLYTAYCIWQDQQATR